VKCVLSLFELFRAKWYKSIQEKRYKVNLKDEGDKNVLETLRTQNEELKSALVKMEAEFPYLKHNLRKINNLVLPSNAQD
jgi:hypothetical protein